MSVFDADSATQLVSHLQTVGLPVSEALLNERWQEILAALPKARREISYPDYEKHCDVLICSSRR